MGIKHRADSGFRKFRTLIKVRFVRTVKYFEMPYVSYPRPLAASDKDMPIIKKMSIKKILSLIFILKTTLIFSQNCDCKSTFGWVKETFENNDAGFQYIIDKKGQESYKIHNQIYFSRVDKINKPKDCESTIREWLAFFRKSHVEFHYLGEDNIEIENTEKINENVTIENEKIESPLHKKYLESNEPFIERLNSKTLYLRIPSFNSSEKSAIDNLIEKYKNEILITENLIIDIRNGTGGSDNSYKNILPFIYTNPIRMPSVEFLSTPLNNRRMYELATNTGFALEFGIQSSEEDKAEFMKNYLKLNNHLGEFVNLNSSKINIYKQDTIYKFPKEVAILINENNVSTDEQFILESRQSKKVKLFGTTTKGGLDMSNLYVAKSENKEFVLVYALSRSLRIPNMIVDDIGIMPDFFLDEEIPEQEWIEFVSEILNQQ